MAVVGLEVLAGIEKEDSWGSVSIPGTADDDLYIEGDGVQMNAARAYVPITSNRVAPAHGISSQHAVGQNITGTYSVPLTTVNSRFLLVDDDYVERNASTGKLNSFYINILKGSSIARTYTGCKVDTCEISCSPGDHARMTWNIIGRDELTSAAHTPLVPASVGLFYPHWAVSFSWDSTVLTIVEDWSVSISNNLVAGPHNAANGTYDAAIISYLEETVQEVSGSFTVLFDTTVFDYQTDIISTTEDFAPLVITLNDGTAGGVDTVIDVKQCYITDANEEGSTGDLKKVTVNWQGAYNASGVLVTFS